MTALLRRWAPAGRASAIVLVLTVSGRIPSRADGGSCGGDEIPRPAAGRYKGDYHVVYDTIVQGMPPEMTMRATISGELTFTIGRQEFEDAPPPPALVPYRRIPAYPGGKPEASAPGEKPTQPAAPGEPTDRARPGQFDNENGDNKAQIEAWWKAYWEEQRRQEAEQAKELGSLADGVPAHIYVPPHQNPRLEGKAKGSSVVSLAGPYSPGKWLDLKGQGTPVEADLFAEERSPDEGFRRIHMKGGLAPGGFSAAWNVTGPDMRYDGTTRRNPDGSVTAGASGHDGKERHSGSSTVPQAPVPGDPKEKVEFMTLEIQTQECGVLKGTIDLEPMRELMRRQGGGVDVKVLESGWEAKHLDRDEGFEKQVDALADEALPAEMSWAYIDSFASRWKAIRDSAGAMSDYKRCVLLRLERKFVRVNLRALATLGKNVPTSPEVTCAVLAASSQRIFEHVRMLQLTGAAECPEAMEALAALDAAYLGYAQKVLSRKHTADELMCLVSLDRAGKLGDLTETFQTALRVALQAAIDKVEAAKAAMAPK
jgi:hypothetical protein